MRFLALVEEWKLRAAERALGFRFRARPRLRQALDAALPPKHEGNGGDPETESPEGEGENRVNPCEHRANLMGLPPV